MCPCFSSGCTYAPISACVRSLYKTGTTGSTYHPILTQVFCKWSNIIIYFTLCMVKLLEALFSSHRPDLTDLQFHAEGLTNKLKATFR